MKKQAPILMVLAMSVVVCLGQQPFKAEKVGPGAVIDISGQKGPIAVVGTRQVQEQQTTRFRALSVIVTFDSSVDPSSLGAATSGKVIHRYKKIFNGATLVLPPDGVETLKSLPGITGIYPDELYHLNTDASPAFIGAPEVWEALGGQEKAGEGVIVGVLDTGIWPEHPSFSDPDPSGKSYPSPGGSYPCNFGNTEWNPNDTAFVCNNKLIGAYEFMDTYKALVGLDPNEFDSARDSDGHGSHTSSTAAGNAGVEASILGTDIAPVSGIAPRAQIIMYRVCGGPAGSCYSSDSAAAVEQAILDGVDVINFSIDGGREPYTDAVSLAFLSAFENGVFVACSAGNSGPGADTVSHREPWTTTVAASTQARSFDGYIHLTADNGDTLDLTGVSIGGAVTGSVVVGAGYGDALCGSVDGVNPFPAGTFTSDQIVICQRGITARVEKSANVYYGGGGGVILYNPTINTLNADNHFVPTVHIDNESGSSLMDFYAAHTGITGSLEGGVMAAAQGDVMAAFSSRGGVGQTLGVSKPDISAPGVNILAAQTPVLAFPIVGGGGASGQLFHAIGGTSMASPHIAGSGALLKALHSDWTPGMIKSALMTTAFAVDLVKEDGLTPADAFDYGSGRVDLNKAGNPGLTISATAQDFITHRRDLWNANYPSLYLPAMAGKVSVQRTLHSVLKKNGPWKLSVESPPDFHVEVPAVLNVKAGKDATFDISLDARAVPLGEVRMATLKLSQKDMVARFPITVVRREPAVTLEKTCTPATIALGETTECTITMTNTSFDEASVSLFDRMPAGLPLVPGSVSGAVQTGGASLSFDGTLYPMSPSSVGVVDGVGTTPAGYLPLSLYGIAPIGGVGDESIVNFSVTPFVYAGQTWNRIGMVSDGYAVVGGGTGADVQFVNQELPDPHRPNNVLAPFWTDLNPAAGGALRAGYLTDGVSTWLILDWEGVVNFDTTDANSFQIWIGTNGLEDISFTYGAVTSGADGFLTVGAENEYGNSGQNWYFNGSGTAVAAGSEVRVESTPGAPGETHVITFTARGEAVRPWTNCVEMTSDLFQGTNTSCFTGETVP